MLFMEGDWKPRMSLEIELFCGLDPGDCRCDETPCPQVHIIVPILRGCVLRPSTCLELQMIPTPAYIMVFSLI
jgi:hypothetical protein